METTTVVPYSVQTVSRTEVIVRGPAALRDWREAHRLPVPGHAYVPSFKSGRWDGTWAPGRWCRQVDETFELRCSIGLLPRIAKDLGFGFPAPAFPALPLDAVPGLRDYQQDALRLASMLGWGRIALATNAGKGAVIALLAARAAAAGHSALILVDELAVFDALQGELATWAAVTPALLQAGVTEPPPRGITLAMVPTLARRLEDEDRGLEWRGWVASHAMLLLDEADKATAETWRRICTAASGTHWRVGFSGSFPEDLYGDLQLEELMGPVLIQEGNAAMVERGVSAKPTVELHPYDVTAVLRAAARDWARRYAGAERRQQIYEAGVVYNPERHARIRALVRPETPTAIIVNRVDHGTQLETTIPGAVFLDGSVGEADRITALEAFRRGEFHVLIVTKILDRGTNRLGYAADVIFASGEGSSRQTLQRIGRGLRRADGKATLRLVDVIDRVDTDQLLKRDPLQKAAAILHGAGRRRAQLYIDEGFAITVRR